LTIFFRRFSSSHPKIVPPKRFIALQSICGLKDLYANIKQTNSPVPESSSNENQASYNIPGLYIIVDGKEYQYYTAWQRFLKSNLCYNMFTF